MKKTLEQKIHKNLNREFDLLIQNVFLNCIIKLVTELSVEKLIELYG